MVQGAAAGTGGRITQPVLWAEEARAGSRGNGWCSGRHSIKESALLAGTVGVTASKRNSSEMALSKKKKKKRNCGLSLFIDSNFF